MHALLELSPRHVHALTADVDPSYTLRLDANAPSLLALAYTVSRMPLYPMPIS